MSCPECPDTAEREADVLLPCPFCGREPYLHGPDFRGDDYQVGCRCGESEDSDGIGGVWMDGETFEEAAERWNLRTPVVASPAAGSETERLRSALQELFPASEGFTEAFDDLLRLGLIVPVPADDAFREEWGDDVETMYVWHFTASEREKMP